MALVIEHFQDPAVPFEERQKEIAGLAKEGTRKNSGDMERGKALKREKGRFFLERGAWSRGISPRS